jgi:hypothetical protein
MILPRSDLALIVDSGARPSTVTFDSFTICRYFTLACILEYTYIIVYKYASITVVLHFSITFWEFIIFLLNIDIKLYFIFSSLLGGSSTT